MISVVKETRDGLVAQATAMAAPPRDGSKATGRIVPAATLRRLAREARSDRLGELGLEIATDAATPDGQMATGEPRFERHPQTGVARKVWDFVAAPEPEPDPAEALRAELVAKGVLDADTEEPAK